jgi:hypothetical protein
MTKFELANKMKKSLATGATVIAVVAGTVPAMAGVNYSEVNSFTSNGSAIGTAVLDNQTTFNATGGNVSVLTADEINIVNSYVDTLVDSGVTNLNIMGRNVDITHFDATNVTDSVVAVYLKQKAKTVNAKEICKKGW